MVQHGTERNGQTSPSRVSALRGMARMGTSFGSFGILVTLFSVHWILVGWVCTSMKTYISITFKVFSELNKHVIFTTLPQWQWQHWCKTASDNLNMDAYYTFVMQSTLWRLSRSLMWWVIVYCILLSGSLLQGSSIYWLRSLELCEVSLLSCLCICLLEVA